MSPLQAWTSRHTAIGLVARLDVHRGPCLGCSVGSLPTSSPRSSEVIRRSFTTTCVHDHPTMLSFRQRPLYSKRVIHPNVHEKPSPLFPEPSCNRQNQQAINTQPPRHENWTSSYNITFTSAMIEHGTPSRLPAFDHGGFTLPRPSNPFSYHHNYQHVILPSCNHPGWFSGDLITRQSIFFCTTTYFESIILWGLTTPPFHTHKSS